jgi:hypothetical protein
MHAVAIHYTGIGFASNINAALKTYRLIAAVGCEHGIASV